MYGYGGKHIVIVEAASTPVGATLMKTGQTTSYKAGDDGDIEAGRATNFTTLAVNNPFSNTSRFTDELGGQTYTNNIVIDWSTYDSVAGTVLGHTRDLSLTSLVLWAVAVDGALTYSTGGFSGWRLTNYIELMSLFNFELNDGFNYSPFTNISPNTSYWTSNTPKVSPSNAFLVSAFGTVTSASKTLTPVGRARYCRTFTVTGITLT